jgi:hypothetical protein
VSIMKSVRNLRKNKHLILDQTKLKKAQQILEAKTETEAIERALDRVISEAEKDRQAWAAHERFLKAAVREGLTIRDVFGRLEDK